MATTVITGVELTSSTTRWTSLRRKKKSQELLGYGEKNLPLGEENHDIDFSTEEVALTLKKNIHDLEGSISTTLPSSCMLMRVVELPAVELDELEGMVELQVDKFSPFPTDQVFYSYEILDQQENATRVLIIAIPKEQVENLGQTFRKGGIILHSVDANIAVWWNLIKEHGDPSLHGQQPIVIIEPNDISLIVLHHGNPVLFRSLGLHTKLRTESDVAELIEEINFSLTALEAEWGAAEEMPLAIWSHQPLPSHLTDQLQTNFPEGITTHELGTLPPLCEGVAHRSANEDQQTINFAPTSWVEDSHYRTTLKKLALLSAIFLGCWILALVFISIYVKQQDNRINKLMAGRTELMQERDRVRSIKKKVMSLTSYADRSHSALEGLLILSTHMPDGIELLRMQYKKGDAMQIKGMADKAFPINDYIAALEKADFFAEVKTDNIVTKRTRSGLRTEFSIELGLPGNEEE